MWKQIELSTIALLDHNSKIFVFNNYLLNNCTKILSCKIVICILIRYIIKLHITILQDKI